MFVDIRAYALYSGMSIADMDRILDNCIHGEVDFLYLSPERLASDLALARIKQMNVSLIAIDEAHCVSQWGYDFRPSYLNIAEIREVLPATAIIFLPIKPSLSRWRHWPELAHSQAARAGQFRSVR